MLDIRLAKADELIYVSALSKEFEKENITYGLIGDEVDHYYNKDIFIAIDNNIVIGYAYGSFELKDKDTSFYKKDDKSYYLEEIYVKKDFRSKGIGTLLFKACEKYAKNNGALWIELSTSTKDYAKALNFYIKMMGLNYWSSYLIKKI